MTTPQYIVLFCGAPIRFVPAVGKKIATVVDTAAEATRFDSVTMAQLTAHDHGLHYKHTTVAYADGSPLNLNSPLPTQNS